MTIGLHHPLDGVTNPEYKLLRFIQLTNFFAKKRSALAFNRDRCCHLALCLRLILFHWHSDILQNKKQQKTLSRMTFGRATMSRNMLSKIALSKMTLTRKTHRQNTAQHNITMQNDTWQNDTHRTTLSRMTLIGMAFSRVIYNNQNFLI
jgi:hypothetical protein